MFVDLSDKFISNNFSGVKMDFRFPKKSEQLALMLKLTDERIVTSILFTESSFIEKRNMYLIINFLA